MNKYDYKFPVICPTDGALIVYHLTIESKDKIMVEHIKSICAIIKEKHQEDIADILIGQFSGVHTITATHSDVLITTVRG
tara:strand:+ start:41 stop:280 length:240 start_codon:yes stop_codon:yes gene_type:complete